ncbi:MAG: FtsQ-type POTRA domain-containing protein [Acidimicrobiia bacterium]|nr:FtsQ-type POTRA domain-containing protein [Acidimicrobiia bacterium]
MTTTAEPRTPRRVDPRIAERRTAVTRTAGRRRLRVILVILALIALAGVGWVLTRSPLLDVDQIDVQGTERTSPADVLGAVGIDRGDPILYVDTGAATARVEALPWVSEASVSRRLPDRVVVRVEERIAAGWIRIDDETVAIVDGTGRVLEDDAPTSLYIPELRGVGSTTPVAGETLEDTAGAAVAASLPEQLLARVAAVSTDGDGTDVRIGLTAGGEVRLGDPDAVDVDDALAAAVAVLDSLGERVVAYVDVRVPSAPVVGPAPG